MNLYENLCDNVKECEMKIGYRPAALSLYYPESSLLELLDCGREELSAKIKAFSSQVKEELGEIVIAETPEQGRYEVKVPEKGVTYIHENRRESEFLKVFLREIRIPGRRLPEIVKVFEAFSKDLEIDREGDHEWGIRFCDPLIDPYVYCVEEDDFGLEYHRFTPKSYALLFEDHAEEQ